MLVFIDDSGDPGFKITKGSSKFFVIALVVFGDPLNAEKTSLCIKELRRNLGKTDSYEFKFNKCNRLTRSKFINAVKDCKFKVRAICVNKKLIWSPHLRKNIENFYNYIVMQVIKHSIGIKDAKLKFDKRGEKILRDELRAYLSRELDNKNNHIFTDLKFVDSKQNTLIQLADMMAGTILYSATKEDSVHLDELKKAGRIEDLWQFK